MHPLFFIMRLSMCIVGVGMCLLIITTSIILTGIIIDLITGLVTGGVAGSKKG